MILRLAIRYRITPQQAAQELHYAWEDYSRANKGSWVDPSTRSRVDAAKERVDKASILMGWSKNFRGVAYAG